MGALSLSPRVSGRAKRNYLFYSAERNREGWHCRTPELTSATTVWRAHKWGGNRILSGLAVIPDFLLGGCSRGTDVNPDFITNDHFSFLLRGAPFSSITTSDSQFMTYRRPQTMTDHSRVPRDGERREDGCIYGPKWTQSRIQVFATFQVVM